VRIVIKGSKSDGHQMLQNLNYNQLFHFTWVGYKHLFQLISQLNFKLLVVFTTWDTGIQAGSERKLSVAGWVNCTLKEYV
jgi:hypothetical protein